MSRFTTNNMLIAALALSLPSGFASDRLNSLNAKAERIEEKLEEAKESGDEAAIEREQKRLEKVQRRVDSETAEIDQETERSRRSAASSTTLDDMVAEFESNADQTRVDQLHNAPALPADRPEEKIGRKYAIITSYGQDTKEKKQNGELTQNEFNARGNTIVEWRRQVDKEELDRLKDIQSNGGNLNNVMRQRLDNLKKIKKAWKKIGRPLK